MSDIQNSKKTNFWQLQNKKTKFILALVIIILILFGGSFSFFVWASPKSITFPKKDHAHFRLQYVFLGQNENFASSKYQVDYPKNICSGGLTDSPIHLHDNTEVLLLITVPCHHQMACSNFPDTITFDRNWFDAFAHCERLWKAESRFGVDVIEWDVEVHQLGRCHQHWWQYNDWGLGVFTFRFAEEIFPQAKNLDCNAFTNSFKNILCILTPETVVTECDLLNCCILCEKVYKGVCKLCISRWLSYKIAA